MFNQPTNSGEEASILSVVQLPFCPEQASRPSYLASVVEILAAGEGLCLGVVADSRLVFPEAGVRAQQVVFREVVSF